VITIEPSLLDLFFWVLPQGDPVYEELTTARRLSAAVVVDRASARVMHVRFRVRK